MRVARAISGLIEAFERLPGIGPKSAARLTYYLFHVPLSESDPCDICADRDRDRSIICVVEQPLDVLAIERGDGYKGVYHVLHGVIDPVHNIGPEEIKIDELVQRCKGAKVQEVILALNPNMEGEATCLYLKRLLGGVKVTRLAHGLPIGGDIEYADDRTLAHAMEGRREY